jgi:riboflavin kinase/FMN adenylyltransferase
MLKSKIIHGSHKGREIGYPTANLEDPAILTGHKEGVYLSRALINGRVYWGMLYLGARFVAGETKQVLEINFFDFDGDLYGKEISFEVLDFVRGPIDIKTFEQLKYQLDKDKKDCLSLIPKYSS